MEIEDTIRKYALENAVKFEGKANPGAIIGKVIAENPGLKKELNTLNPKIQDIVKAVNSLPSDEQKKQLEAFGPIEKKKKEHDIFDFLGIKEDGIVTCFPPGPEKYPHIGHAKACYINYMLAKKYKGYFILRFEDTNPNTVEDKYYEAMINDFRWLGIEWSELYYASDYMDLYYSHAEQLIKDGQAYVCFCDGEAIKKSRSDAIACKCRDTSPEENIKAWAEFTNYEEGSAILRLKIDLDHQNSTMRDPTLFRIIDGNHARQKEKYRVWPTYDMQTSVLDGKLGITHRLRSKEFEMRNELQRYLQTLLGYKETNIYEFARFNMEGVPSSGRKIREMLEKKELIGWDDPKLNTLIALRRRGFIPEAIKEFVISTGITKSESTLTWDDLIVHNRRLLDSKVNRYFFIDDPVKVKIEGTPEMTVHLNKHPEFKDRGTRDLRINEYFYLAKADYESLEKGLYRLMDAINFTKEGDTLKFDSTDHLVFKEKGKKIMHFLPTTDLVEVEVMMPNHTIRKGYGEKTIEELEVGDIIQFERFGFCRLDSKDKVFKFWFTH